MAGEGVAPSQLPQNESAPLELVVLAQPLQSGNNLVQLCAGGISERLTLHRLGGEEQQRLERPFELQAHAEILSPLASSARTVTSPNGSS